ncbi:MAG: M20/M25/M40 family metallo-hydrolase [Bacteroidales bacterium]|nr:M20/M25/M40 family metallo-hydrolase [Bacteroidales bacterium]
MKFITTALILLANLSIFAQSITQKELKEHVTYLASDELKGRKPGTEGGKLSAEYIRNEFKKSGLILQGDDGFQYFNIVTGIKHKSNNHLYINKFSCKALEDNIPFPFSGNGTVSAKAIFVGYGFDINTDKIEWNDYKNIDVKGKWVLILRGDPEMKNRNSDFIPYSSDRSKVMTAIKKGAAGVLMVSGETFDRDDKLVELKYGRGNAQVEIPVLHVSRQVADRVLNNDKSITDYEIQLIQEKKTKSFVTNSVIKAIVNIEYVKTQTQNITAMIPGNNKTLSEEFIVIGAHYDHLGFGGKNSGSRMPDTIAVHNGADDNASGIASILEIAERFKDENIRPDRSILFIAFGAEERGLLGSSYFVNNPLIDMNNVYAMLNLDMVGRLNEEKTVTISGTGTAIEFNSFLDTYKDKTDIKFAYSPGGYGASDHSSFYLKDIPVLFFNTGAHQDYHTPFDDVETLNFPGQVNVTNLIFDILTDLAERKINLTFQTTGNPKNSRSHSRGFKVTLGIMPGFGDNSNKGLRVDGTRKDGPAETGGMKRGDVITAINGEKISNIYDYMEILGKLENGQRIMVDIMREGKKVVLAIQL